MSKKQLNPRFFFLSIPMSWFVMVPQNLCTGAFVKFALGKQKKNHESFCKIGDREFFFGALFILWIHGKTSHIRTTCKLGGHDPEQEKKLGDP